MQKNPKDTDLVLQIFKGVDGRTGRLQWVLYRTDTLGELGHGEGTGADTKQGQEGIARDVCSTIRDAVKPPPEEVGKFQPSTEGMQPAIDAWKNSASSLEASFSHLRFSPPKGFSALSKDIRKRRESKSISNPADQGIKEGRSERSKTRERGW